MDCTKNTGQDKDTYTAGEAIKATGIPRQTFINRCRQLCIKMANCYTEDEIFKIASYVPHSRNVRGDRVKDLRDRLNKRLADEGTGLCIETAKDGTATIRKSKGGRQTKKTAGQTATKKPHATAIAKGVSAGC